MTVKTIHAKHWKESPSAILALCLTSDCKGTHTIENAARVMSAELSSLVSTERVIDYYPDVAGSHRDLIANIPVSNARRHDIDAHKGKGRVVVFEFSTCHNTETAAIRHLREKLALTSWHEPWRAKRKKKR